MIVGYHQIRNFATISWPEYFDEMMMMMMSALF